LHRNLTETGAYDANGRRNSQVRISGQRLVLTRSDWIRRVLSIELSRFYHGKNDATGL
jgi:hypothetical protein